MDLYWSQSTDVLLARAESTLAGLSEQQVQQRQTSLRDNQLGNSRPSRLALLAAQFNNPIILLLLATAILSFALDDATNGMIVLVILGLSGALGYWQENSAADAVARLLLVIDTLVSVRRHGQVVNVSRTELVPGDIVLVKAGSVVPADCRLLESNSLLVDESALTGESFPVEKHTTAIDSATPLAQRSNCLYLGTHVASGSGTALVICVGKQTELGKISGRLESRAASTDFERGLRRFGSLLVLITALLIVAVFVANVAFARPIVESLLFALALAVGMTPQLLPAITSVVLASGAKLMAKSEVIVKRLVVIENFGSMDTLCMDKTGTITSGTIELHQALDTSGAIDNEVLRLAWLNASLQASFENPIDAAIMRAAQNQFANNAARRLDELPYDFRRKRLTVLVKERQQSLLITKGAFQKVLEICSQVRIHDQTLPLAEAQSAIEEQFQQWSRAGYRVLAVATRAASQDQLRKADESNMTLVGLLTFADPLKPDIEEALGGLRELGIDLKLVTGDNAAVASTLAVRAGFTNPRVITGREIHEWDAEQLSAEATQADIFAEVEPDQKEKIVLALRQAHRVVGFLGDGINDAPALHAADVGISVSGAVDVAKEAAQVVLLRPDLNVLSQGVREGRRTLNNTLKYIYFAISANFGYMLSMAIASLFLPFLPLLPAQILLINLLADFPAMALATDRVDPESIVRPRRWEMSSIVRFMLTFGLAGTCSDLLTFWTLLNVFEATPEQFRAGWFTVSILTGLLIMLVIRTSRPFVFSRPGRWLLIAAGAVAVVTLSLPYTPAGRLFELAPPTPWLYAAVILICSFYVAMLEGLKRVVTQRQ